MVDFSDFQSALTTLTAANAFEDHRSMRLLMPNPT